MTPKTPAPIAITPDKAKTLEKLIRVSKRVKIDDMASVLDIPRRGLLLKLVDLSDQFQFKIEEDLVVFEAVGESTEFVQALEKEFESWGKSKEKV